MLPARTSSSICCSLCWAITVNTAPCSKVYGRCHLSHTRCCYTSCAHRVSWYAHSSDLLHRHMLVYNNNNSNNNNSVDSVNDCIACLAGLGACGASLSSPGRPLNHGLSLLQLANNALHRDVLRRYLSQWSPLQAAFTCQLNTCVLKLVESVM